MSQLDSLKYKYNKLNVLEKLIAINVIIFVLALIFKPIVPVLFRYLELPPDFYDALLQPWSIISYAFLHYGPFHLLFNMLWLYICSRIFLNLLSSKMALNIYFLGAIAGGLTFLLFYNLFPSFFSKSFFPLVGASAAVRALFIFLCAYIPNNEIKFFTFNIKIWHIGAVLIGIDVLGVFGTNGGGNLAHLGGALLGYIYAKQIVKGNDIGKGFERSADAVSSWFKPSKKSKLKTVYKDKSKVGGYTKGEFNELNKQKQIDVILDKISKSGYESLTAKEKDFLFRAGK
ncbi:rhomboid family intramembrane serine protease [uncultured Lacinutrix sp.]|uniref:rhomboid family intramembrane serine protease n=1 Tax=uncultured Lacinutrix sp. TaxID=574032 RepID=UPI002638475B|nr:rhomboid family intramembrane serine protease [uncultured Lacinutrix sp.]